jgi:hypothetical protein
MVQVAGSAPTPGVSFFKRMKSMGYAFVLRTQAKKIIAREDRSHCGGNTTVINNCTNGFTKKL